MSPAPSVIFVNAASGMSCWSSLDARQLLDGRRLLSGAGKMQNALLDGAHSRMEAPTWVRRITGMQYLLLTVCRLLFLVAVQSNQLLLRSYL